MRQRLGGDSAETKLIQIALVMRGWSMTELAKRAGLARTYVSEIVHGRLVRPKAQARIARVLGMGMERAFPKVEVEVEVESGRRGEIPRRTEGEIPRCARNDRRKGKE